MKKYRRRDEHGNLEYLCCYCGKPYARFEQPVFVMTPDGEETVHSKCLFEQRKKDGGTLTFPAQAV